MRRMHRIERREILNGWIKWAILPMIPFSVLFFDAWLNIQIRYKDYELSQLSAERRALDGDLDLIRAQEARQSGVEQLTRMAEQLQLAPPDTQQFRSVAFREVQRRVPVMSRAATEIPATQPAAIQLGEAALVTVAKNTPVAPQASGQSNVAPGEVLLTPVSPPMFLQHETPIQDVWPQNEDDELSILTIEDMLGKL